MWSCAVSSVPLSCPLSPSLSPSLLHFVRLLWISLFPLSTPPPNPPPPNTFIRFYRSVMRNDIFSQHLPARRRCNRFCFLFDMIFNSLISTRCRVWKASFSFTSLPKTIQIVRTPAGNCFSLCHFKGTDCKQVFSKSSVGQPKNLGQYPWHRVFRKGEERECCLLVLLQ